MLRNIYQTIPNIILRYPWPAKLYFRAKHQLMDRFRSPPILIYQMGKVGSAAIKKSLTQYKLGRSVYHVHNLVHYQAIKDLKWHLNKSGTSRRYDGLWSSLYLSKQVARPMPFKWTIITFVREPVGRNLSGFFQVMDRLHPEFLTERSHSETNIDEILKSFLVDNTHHSVPLHWFDNQLKTVFGIDVFKLPFNHQKGYQIYENEKAKALLIRLENLDDCAQQALEDFLAIKNFKLLSKNVGNAKNYKNLYKHVIKEIKLPEDYLNSLYDSKYANHFYTKEEISMFRKKWES